MNAVQKEKLIYRLSILLVLLLVFIAVFGSYLMPHGITSAQQINLIHDPSGKFKTPPFPPSKQFWLGTDHRGYDILALLLNGAKYTLGFGIAVTIIRFVIAVPLGMFAGVTGRLRSAISILQTVTTSVPAFLFLYPTMAALFSILGLNNSVATNDPKQLVFAETFAVLLVAIGIFPLMHQFAERAHSFAQKPYIEASRTLGASHSRIVFRHLMPHLRPELLFAFLTELVQVLFLIGQLAVVGLFLGGGQQFELEPGVNIVLTQTGEWGGMIAYGTRYIRNYPWIIASAGLFFTSAILILTFFSKQLQKRLAHSYMHPNKPLYQNKPALITIEAVAVACAATLLWLPNKAPGVQTVSAQPVKTGQKPSATPQPTAPRTPDDFMEQRMQPLQENAQKFLQYLAENKWGYASSYLQNTTRFVDTTKNPPIPKPFDQWMADLSSKKVTFVSFGKISKGREIKVDDGDMLIGTFLVEVKLQDATGKPLSWTLTMSEFKQVVSGKSEPLP